MLLYLLSLLGVAVFAASGALSAGRKGFVAAIRFAAILWQLRLPVFNLPRRTP